MASPDWELIGSKVAEQPELGDFYNAAVRARAIMPR